MNTRLATNEEFTIESGSGGVLKAPSIAGGTVDVMAKVSQIDDINAKIPGEASRSNPLADREWVQQQIGSAHGDATLEEVWRCTPSTLDGAPISISVSQSQGVRTLTPTVDGQAVGNAKQAPSGTLKVEWKADGEWQGDTCLSAMLGYTVGEGQGDMPIQPAGNYLTTEDFQDVEVQEFTVRTIDVKDGGSVELNPGATITLAKGAGEAHVVVQSGESSSTITFPARNGEIALDSDLASKIDAVAGGTQGNLASLTASGGISDSGISNSSVSAAIGKLSTIDENAQVNAIETVKVNGSALEVVQKSVNVSVPTVASPAPDASTGQAADAKEVGEWLYGPTQTWQDSLPYNDQASNFSALMFRPRAFDMPDGACLRIVTLTNSRSTSTNQTVYIKLMDADGLATLAQSDSQTMDTKGQDYTFTFGAKHGLLKDTQYRMVFFNASGDSVQNVNLNLQSGQDSPDLYLMHTTRIDLRPKAHVVWQRPGLYAKPFNGIPKGDLDPLVQDSLDRADASASSGDIALTYAYGDDMLESKWELNIGQLQGHEITMSVVQTQQGGINAFPSAGGSSIAMNPIALHGDETTLTWYPIGSGEENTWMGSETLVATRTDRYLKLGSQTAGIQPAGDYAEKDKFISKVQLAAVVASVDAQTGTTEDKFNALMGQLRTLAGS